jgi:hypothetical protein
MAIDHRRLALGLCGVRIANGLVLTLTPNLAATLYLGPGGKQPTARALARFTGARELVLGVGAMAAVMARTADAEAMAAGAVCDGIDFFVSVLSPGLAARTRIAAPSAAAGAVAGLWAARALAQDRRAPAAIEAAAIRVGV